MDRAKGDEDMLDSCGKHPHEAGVALCRRCGGAWCASCLVYAFGPRKPPYCLSCAMVAGGVRTSAALPAMPRRQIKAQMRALKAEAKTAAKTAAKAEAPLGAGATPPGDSDGSSETSPEVERELAEAYRETDWSTPWWEDRQPTLAD
ncbi:MAG: hypothetical protein ABL966_08155 [Acidimicrobiales bacterium]